MNMWVMQYRIRETDKDEWGDWMDLPETLSFSSFYVPRYFEFRAMAQTGKRSFVFVGKAINEAVLNVMLNAE